MISRISKLFYISFFLIILLSSCKTKDPFLKEKQNSTINLAVDFVKKIENPKSKKELNQGYQLLSLSNKNDLSFENLHKVIEERYTNKQIYKRKTETIAWEKKELKDGTALVYVLHKFQFSPFKLKYQKYAIFRIHLLKENEFWVVNLASINSFEKIFTISTGDLLLLTDEKIFEIKQAIKEDVSEFQFKLDMLNMPSQEEDLSNKCIMEGEKLYDQEEYRRALMQFQKALSINPGNDKAKVYISRCRKALSFTSNNN